MLNSRIHRKRVVSLMAMSTLLVTSATRGDTDSRVRRGPEKPGGAPESFVAQLGLAADAACLGTGQTVNVTLRMANLGTFQAAGFQAFLSFDTTRLTFISGAYTAAPFGLHVISPITAVGGNIDLAAGIDQFSGQAATSVDADLVTLTFQTLVEDCPGSFVAFRSHTPPTGITDTTGAAAPGLVTVDTAPIAIDATLPIVTCPLNAAIACDASTAPANTGTATATDNCGAPVITSSDSVVAGLCPQDSTITRTWTATDACGNAAMCAQTITLTDSAAPVLTLPANTTIQCGTDSSPTTTGTASAVDNCDAAPTVTSSDVVTAGVCAQASVITRTWTATDACANSISADQVITVTDTTAPVLTLPANVAVECGTDTSPTTTGTASAVDNCDAAPTITSTDVVTAGACAQASVITRTWTATDACGNSTSADQVITVSDTTAPVLTLPANLTVECGTDTSPTATGTASAVDNCDAAPTITSSDVVTAGVCAQASVITRTWTATDACGNSTSADQVITVSDTTAPVLTLPANLTVECGTDTSPTTTGTATAVDNCDAAPTITSSDVVTAGVCAQASIITRTWTATDACGNSAGADQIINVADSTAPVITCPLAATIECDVPTDPANTGGSATASDNCDGAPTIGFSDTVTAGLCAQESTVTRTWTATDACGNVASCAQTVNIVDTTAPIITCPADISLNADAGACNAALTLTAAAAADACDGMPAVVGTRSDLLALAAPYPSGTTTVTWQATDQCGNVSQCLQQISVSAFNEFVVDVELSPNIITGASPDTLPRCVTFELFDCVGGTSTVVSQAIDFNVQTGMPTVGSAALLVPCGSYGCTTAQDPLHTLRRTDESFGIVGTQYVAAFTGDVATGGDWLVNGNLDGNAFVDIFDFGAFAGQWATNFGVGDTTCATAGPHADLSGNGLVFTEDFTFIQINFLDGAEANCCGLPALPSAPVTAISVEQLRRRGLGHLAVGDLNGDGWLDAQDMAAFLQGDRPATTPPVKTIKRIR